MIHHWILYYVLEDSVWEGKCGGWGGEEGLSVLKAADLLTLSNNLTASPCNKKEEFLNRATQTNMGTERHHLELNQRPPHKCQFY